LNAGNAPQSSISADAPGAIIDGNTFVAREAYDELMSAFFPPPNLLLADGEEHTRARKRWQEQMSSFSDDVAGSVTSIMAEHIAKWKNGDWLDIYESMKELSWKILLKCFLEL
jgi:cytochrome P450